MAAPGLRCRELGEGNCKFTKDAPTLAVEGKPAQARLKCEACGQFSIYTWEKCMLCSKWVNLRKGFQAHMRAYHDDAAVVAVDHDDAAVVAVVTPPHPDDEDEDEVGAAAAAAAAAQSHQTPQSQSPSQTPSPSPSQTPPPQTPPRPPPQTPPPPPPPARSPPSPETVGPASRRQRVEPPALETRLEEQLFADMSQSERQDVAAAALAAADAASAMDDDDDDDDALGTVPLNQLVDPLGYVDELLGSGSCGFEQNEFWWNVSVVTLNMVVRFRRAEERQRFVEAVLPRRDRLVMRVPAEESWVSNQEYDVLLRSVVQVDGEVSLTFNSFGPKAAFFSGLKVLPVERVTARATFLYPGSHRLQDDVHFYLRANRRDVDDTQQEIIRLARSLGKSVNFSDNHNKASSKNGRETTNDGNSGGQSGHQSSLGPSASSRLKAADRALVVMSRRLMAAKSGPLLKLEREALASGFPYLLHELVDARLGPIVRLVVRRKLLHGRATGADVVAENVLAFFGWDASRPRDWAASRLVQAFVGLAKKQSQTPETTPGAFENDDESEREGLSDDEDDDWFFVPRVQRLECVLILSEEPTCVSALEPTCVSALRRWRARGEDDGLPSSQTLPLERKSDEGRARLRRPESWSPRLDDDEHPLRGASPIITVEKGAALRKESAAPPADKTAAANDVAVVTPTPEQLAALDEELRGWRNLGRTQDKKKEPSPTSSRSAFADDDDDDDKNFAPPLLCPLDRGLARKDLERYDPTADSLAACWVQTLTGLEVGVPLVDGLKDGVVLCELVSVIRPGILKKKPYRGHRPWRYNDNIAAFLDAAKTLGVRRDALFDTTDLVNSRDRCSVVRCLEALADRARVLRPDLPALLRHADVVAPKKKTKAIVALGCDLKDSPVADGGLTTRDSVGSSSESSSPRRLQQQQLLQARPTTTDHTHTHNNTNNNNNVNNNTTTTTRLPFAGLRLPMDRAIVRDEMAYGPLVYLVVWSIALKEAVPMERAEVRLCRFLQTKNLEFELVYLDLTPDRKGDLYRIAGGDVNLPCLTFGPEYHGSYETLKEKDANGTFDPLTVLARQGRGFWVKPLHCKVVRLDDPGSNKYCACPLPGSRNDNPTLPPTDA